MSFENESPFWEPVKRKNSNMTSSPLRENLIKRFAPSLKPKRLFDDNVQYPKVNDENHEEFCRMTFSPFKNPSNFRFMPNSPIKQDPTGELSKFSPDTETSPLLRPLYKEAESNSATRDRFVAYSEVLHNEIFGPKDQGKRDFKAEFSTPTKRKIRSSEESPKRQIHNGLFEKSPKVSVSTHSHEVLASPKMPKQLPESYTYKVLDAPGLIDDFYLKLIDWSPLNVVAVALGSKLYFYTLKNENVKMIVDVSKKKETISSLAWSKIDPNKILVGTSKGYVFLWDVEVSKVVINKSIHRERIGTIVWNENCFTSGSKDKRILCYDIRSSIINKDAKNVFSRHSHEICGLAWNPSGNILASGGNDNRLILWSIHNYNKPLMEFRSHIAAVRALAWSPHKHGLLASGGGSADRTIKFWDSLTLSEQGGISSNSQVCNLLWDQNSHQILSTHGYNDNSINIWDYPDMKTLTKMNGHRSRVLQMSVSPNGEDIVTGAGDETVRFWKVFPLVINKKNLI